MKLMRMSANSWSAKRCEKCMSKENQQRVTLSIQNSLDQVSVCVVRTGMTQISGYEETYLSGKMSREYKTTGIECDDMVSPGKKLVERK